MIALHGICGGNTFRLNCFISVDALVYIDEFGSVSAK